MRLKLWGTRGSLPSPITPDQLRLRFEEVVGQYERIRDAGIQMTAEKYLDTLPPHLLGGYGGNTSCGEIAHEGSRVIIDGGSGIRGFGEACLAAEPDTHEFHIYFTHFHWDHMIGLPFFVPMYMKGKTVHMYSVDDDLEPSLRALFRRPNFPVPYEVVERQIKLHKVEKRKPFRVGHLQLTPYQTDHPDACWGVRVEGGGKSVAWSVDNEASRTSREELGEDVGLYRKADVMVFDAQYSFGDAMDKINWGHSSGPVGLDIALREEVKLALFVHHDPAAPDELIRQGEEQTQHYYEELLKGLGRAGKPLPQLQWRFAREGEEIML